MTAPPTDRELQALGVRTLRREARKGLLAFAKFVVPGYQVGRPHRIMAEALERVQRGECNRLILEAPRRHGKSLMVSQIFPAYCLGLEPRYRMVQCGYAESLTVAHSRKARALFTGERFRTLFPDANVRDDSMRARAASGVRQTAHEWGTSQGGSYYAVGIGGGLAGLGFHCGLIDDFCKNRREAQSATTRDYVHDWFRSVFYPAQDSDEIRREAAIVITATRWHPDDLIARVRAQSLVEGDDDARENWEVITLPAIDAHGEALWAERWPLEKLARIRAVIGSREFSAQYQQDPKDIEGAMMRREWFRIVRDCPRNSGQLWCRFWDLAGTEKSVKSSDPDWTVGALVTQWQGVWYIVGLRRLRATERTIRDAVRQCAELDPYGTRIRIEQEPGAGSKNLIAAYQSDVLVGYDVRPVPAVGDKALRAGPLAAAAEAGNVCLVVGPGFLTEAQAETILAELEALPNGDHDDVCDGITGALADLAGSRSSGTVASLAREAAPADRPADGYSPGRRRGLVY